MFLEIAFSTSKLPEILSYHHIIKKPASKMGKLAGLIWKLASRMGKPERNWSKSGCQKHGESSKLIKS